MLAGHPELLLQQLQRHERMTTRHNDRMYGVETAAASLRARADGADLLLEATKERTAALETAQVRTCNHLRDLSISGMYIQ